VGHVAADTGSGLKTIAFVGGNRAHSKSHSKSHESAGKFKKSIYKQCLARHGKVAKIQA
jgi:hypothetical protein